MRYLDERCSRDLERRKGGDWAQASRCPNTYCYQTSSRRRSADRLAGTLSASWESYVRSIHFLVRPAVDDHQDTSNQSEGHLPMNEGGFLQDYIKPNDVLRLPATLCAQAVKIAISGPFSATSDLTHNRLWMLGLRVRALV